MNARRGFAWLFIPLLFVAAFVVARAVSAIGRVAPAASGPGSAPAPAVAKSAEHHFEPWDLTLDAGGTPLAAWQVAIEPVETNGAPSIVGIEGGDSSPFAEPPAYDPTALDAGRVVLGAFSLRDNAELPRTAFRAATIHLDFPVPSTLDAMRVRVEAAADSAGQPISVEATLVRRRNP